MRVKFRTMSASAFGIINVGDIVDVSDSEAKLLIQGGYAVAVDEPVSEEPKEAEEKPKRKSSKKAD